MTKKTLIHKITKEEAEFLYKADDGTLIVRSLESGKRFFISVSEAHEWE